MTSLDNPVWHALTGPQAKVAEGDVRACRYRPEYSVFSGLPDDPDADSWAALATLSTDPALLIPPLIPPSSWTPLGTFAVHQMVLDRRTEPSAPATATALGAGDLVELSGLVVATEPGPWQARTHELGQFFGVRIDGRLVAAAGQRMRLPDAIEISAVCTAESHRGRGYAAVAVMATVDAILAEGGLPFLHVRHDNTAAITLYERLGFVIRTTFAIGMYQPDGPSAEN